MLNGADDPLIRIQRSDRRLLSDVEFAETMIGNRHDRDRMGAVQNLDEIGADPDQV